MLILVVGVVNISPITLANAALTASLSQAHWFLFLFFLPGRKRAIALKFYSVMAGSAVVFIEKSPYPGLS